MTTPTKRRPKVVSSNDSPAIDHKTTNAAADPISPSDHLASDQSMPIDIERAELLTIAEFEAVTKTNMTDLTTKLVLRMFLQINYIWHLSRHMQGKNSGGLYEVDWAALECRSKRMIDAALPTMLKGIDPTPWESCDDDDDHYYLNRYKDDQKLQRALK